MVDLGNPPYGEVSYRRYALAAKEMKEKEQDMEKKGEGEVSPAEKTLQADRPVGVRDLVHIVSKFQKFD